MICPKCEFSQPDDIYCANCGVNVENYLRKKKKSRYKVGINLALIFLVVLFAAKFFFTGNEAEKSRTSKKDDSTQRLQTKTPTDSPRPLPPERQPVRRRGTAARSSLDEPKQQVAPRGESGEKTLTAREWFEKGLSLDDDSDTEIESYQKAIELNPKFAPAYYRLGAIYFRQAEYDRAAENFAKFTLYASDPEKQAYNVELYFSQEDLEILREAMEEPAPVEEEQEVAAKPEGAESVETAEEVSTETSEEVESIIRFSSTNGHMVVPVLLNGSRTADLLFDTGAGITVLSRELAQNLGLAPEAGRSIKLKTVAAEVQAQIATLDSITVGDFSRADLSVAIVDLNLDDKRRFEGILGMDFLSNYTIRIDNQTSRIFLSPR
jgi:clan AA aspartic protease (TIGR02281 family)